MSVKNGNVTLMVADMNKSLEFYSKLLGFKIKSHYGDHFAEVVTEGLTIGLHPKGKPREESISGSSNISIGLSVENLASAMDALTKQGIVFEKGITDDGQVKIANFRDPDGNSLYLAELKKWG
jgi:catechol 2,3-dioxygenase-like lactoylglutathione lyase family enzyme